MNSIHEQSFFYKYYKMHCIALPIMKKLQYTSKQINVMLKGKITELTVKIPSINMKILLSLSLLDLNICNKANFVNKKKSFIFHTHIKLTMSLHFNFK